MPGTEALVLEGVEAGYGRGPVLREVDLAVGAGEVVGLVGPNGSGKTTVIRVASRTLPPTRGRVRVVGRDPYAVPGREAARLLAVVPQDVVPAFSFSALETVLLGRSPYLSRWGGGGARDWTRAREAMASVGVQHLADRPIDELSGGERQRVILAQALAQDAPVLLLDEPTTHLDVRHVLDLLRILRSLAEGAATAVLAIFHDLDLAAATCDRIVALHRGRVVAAGRPEGVVTSSLLEEVYGVEAEVEIGEASGRPRVSLHLPRAPAASVGRRAHVVGGAGRGAPLVRRLVELGLEVTVGVLHASDTDAEVAERLNLERIGVPAFSEIDDAAAEACSTMLHAADVAFVCDAPFGPGNVRNLELALDAARSGTEVVLVGERPISERDFTGGRATELWEELSRFARRAATYEEAASLAG